MTERILGPTGGRRRRRLVIMGPLGALAVLVGLFVSSSAVAVPTCATQNVVSGSVFEIDTDANLSVDGGADCIDWNNSGTNTKRSGVLAKDDKPTGSGDDSFGQGTAEDNPDPTIVDGSIPPNKSDLKTFGVYTETTGGAKYLELFWSRVQNPSGTTNMDFELNQNFCDGTATNCANNGSSKSPVYVTPKRKTGDKLITYDLSKGGTVPTISIRTWGGSAWGSPTVISGAGGTAIGSVNSSAISGANSFIGSQDPFTFGEVALAYSAIFPSGTSGCGTFGSAYLKSRSSDSFPAELKDFIAPEPVQITNCSSLTTRATASVTIGDPISDTATLSGATSNAGGTITFHLWSNDTCTSEVNTGLSPVAVSGNGDYNSGNFTPTAVGTYYWTAVYSGDPNNAGSSTACKDSGETSVVNKKQPGITTSATASVTIGSAISDTATLSGATSDAGGTVTFHLWSNDTCTTEVSTGLNAVSVNGNGNYNSGDFTPTAVGTYYWTAVYSGDAKNLTSSTACKDSGETSVVNKKQPGITTSATASVTIGSAISDTATVSGATSDAGGTVTFHLWSNDTCTTEVSTGLSAVTVNGNGDYNSGNFTPTAAGTYYWTAVYSGDAKNLTASTACKDSGETSVVQRANPGISTSQSIVPQDSATISGSSGTPTGTVTFKLFGPGNSTCDSNGDAPVFTQTVSLSSGSASTSNTIFSVSAATASTYRWLVVYSGDGTYNGVTSTCGTERFTLTIVS